MRIYSSHVRLENPLNKFYVANLLARRQKPCGILLRQCFSTKPKGLKEVTVEGDQQQKLKSFSEIVVDATKRLHEKQEVIPPRANFPRLQSIFHSKQASAPMKAGDFFWNGSSVEFILRMPQTYQDHLLTMNMRGIVTETSWARVKTRLGSGLLPSALNIPLKELVLNEVTVDEVSIHDKNAAPELVDSPALSEIPPKSYADAKVVGRPVASWIFRLVARHLREYHNEIESRAHNWKAEVIRQVLTELQNPEKVVVLPLIQFVKAVTRSENISMLDFCAIQLCLEQSQLQFSVQKSVSYVSTDTLMIWPLSWSNELTQAQYSPTVSDTYLQSFANGDMLDGLSESRAIEELRKRFPEAEFIDQQEAAELLKLKDGGMWDKFSYQWLYQNAADHRLNPQGLQDDRLAKIREDFDEPVYCIDNSTSKLAEDGISVKALDPSNRKFRVGVHISDPAAFMDLRAEFGQKLPLACSVLVRTFLQRMLPLSFTKALCLESNRPSLSLFADVNLDTGVTDNVVIKPLKLTNVQNLRLDKLDVTQAPFDSFWRIVQMRLNQRFNRGAFLLDTYAEDVNSSGSYEGSQSASSLPLFKASDGHMYTIVEEFMVFANELMALYCRDNKIPIYYRKRDLLLPTKQLKSEFNDQRMTNNGFLGIHWRKVISSGRLSVLPAHFSGTGCALNTRFTSPLRKLDDLIVHAQVEAHLLKETTPFSMRDLESFKDRFQVMEYYHQMFQRDRVFLETLRRANIAAGMKFLGVVVKNVNETRSAAIYLPELKLYADYKGQRDLPIELKQQFTISRVLRHGRSVHVE